MPIALTAGPANWSVEVRITSTSVSRISRICVCPVRMRQIVQVTVEAFRVYREETMERFAVAGVA